MTTISVHVPGGTVKVACSHGMLPPMSVASLLGKKTMKFFKAAVQPSGPAGEYCIIDLLLFLVGSKFKYAQSARLELAKDIAAALALQVEVTRNDTSKWDDDVLGLPCLITPKGRVRKITRGFKQALVRTVQKSKDVNHPKHCLAGMKMWSGKKVPTKKWAGYWDWDVFFGHLACGWRLMRKHGSLCVNTDGVWLSGEDTSYYNFLDPSTDVNTWAPVQVAR
eukprot:6588205-Lingulodinium_polyedra.AAC.1